MDHFGGGCPTLLLQPTRTNIQIRSEEFDNSAWGKINASITADNIIAPDGEMTGDKLTSTATSTSTYVYEQHSLSTSTTYSMSVFVKKGTSNLVQMDLQDFTSGLQGRIKFDLDTETISNVVGTASVDNYGNGWYRLKCTFTTSSTLGIHYFRIFEFSTTNGATLYLWGAQIEAGNYCSSYIKTIGTQITRQKDQCFINSGIDNIINTNEGTIYFEIETFRVSTSSDFDRVVLSDQTSTTDRVIFDNFNGSWRVVLTSSSGTQTASIRSVQANTKIKVAFTYSSSQIKVSYDGNDATTTSITYTPANTLESFKFSNAAGNNQFFQGKIHEVKYFDTILSNTELKELTTL